MWTKTNADGSTTVTCDGGESVTINPAAAPSGSGAPVGKPPLAQPGTGLAFMVTRQPLGALDLGGGGLAGMLDRHRSVAAGQPSGTERALVLHVAGELDVTRLRAAMREAGMDEDVGIEIVPVTHRG